jgi:endogenous inhibitor of DNA gyrase (YacG/DUF329 family)
MIDLGEWMAESHRIAGEQHFPPENTDEKDY